MEPAPLVADVYTVMSRDCMVAVINFKTPIDPIKLRAVIGHHNPVVKSLKGDRTLEIDYPSTSRVVLRDKHKRLKPTEILARAKQVVSGCGFAVRMVAPPRNSSR